MIKIIRISQAVLLSSCLFLPVLAQADSGKSSNNAQIILPNNGALKVESGASINGINVTVEYVDKKKKNDEAYNVTLNLTGPCQFSDGGTSKSHTDLMAAFNQSYNVSVNSTATALCKLQVQVTGDAGFNQSKEFKIQQHLHWLDTAPTSKIATDAPFDLRAQGRNNNGNSSGIAPTYTSANTGVCTISTAGKVTNVASGTCSISATVAGNTNWTATDIAGELVAKSWQVLKDTQQITVTTDLPETAEVGTEATAVLYSKSVNLNANSGLPLTFDAAGCVLKSTNSTSATVDFDRIGTCNLTVNSAGNGKYDPAINKVLSTIVTPKLPQTFAYVKPQATGAGNCTSWANACSNIQTALNMADAVYMARGVYRVSTPITMDSAKHLLGGYLGTETDMDAANPNGAVNLTILTADKDNNDTTLDGYTENPAGIKGSNTTTIITANNRGKGVADAIFISDVVLTGAISSAVTVTGSNMYITNSMFVGNKSANGGAINSDNSLVTIESSAFIANQATAKGGAIVTANTANEVTIKGALFAGNKAASEGGAISAPQGKLNVVNATFSGNELTQASGNGGAVHLAGNTQGVEIMYATFINNAAGAQSSPNGNGGAIYVTSSANNVKLLNSLLMENKANKGANIYGADKINTVSRNLVGYNGQSGMVTTASGNPTYNFPTNGTSQSFTPPDADIEAIVDPVLRNNGGLLASHAIDVKSVAKNYVPATDKNCGAKGGENDVTIDGRMLNRPAIKSSSCDIGAYEVSEGLCDKKTPGNIHGRKLFENAENSCGSDLLEIGFTGRPLLFLLTLLVFYRARKLIVT